MSTFTERTYKPKTHREAMAELCLMLPRTPDCHPWCTLHCQIDETTTFCMGPDILTPVTPNGYVGLTSCSQERGLPMIDLGDGMDHVTVEQAEELARAILAQVARARGQEVAK